MTFPETPLPVKVEISLDNETWMDITGDVRSNDQIQITRGRSDWGQQVDAGQCRLTLDNRTGKYSPRNPEGDYYGQIGRNTPIRVSVNTGDTALDLPGEDGDYISTPDASALDITGDIDIRIDATLENWMQPDYPSAGKSSVPRTELVAKRDSDSISWAFYVSAGRPLFEYSSNGSSTTWFSSGADLPVNASGRVALRFVFDVNNGASGHFVAFYTAETIDGPWTELSSGTFSGTKSIFSSSAPLRIGDAVREDNEWHAALGRVHAVQLYSGIDGTVVANPDFTSLTPGTTSFTDDAGRTWTVAGNAEITDRKTRFVGEVSSWNTRWDTGGFDVTTEVEAAGVLRRLGQGAVPTKSPMYREFASEGRQAAGIVAYWPMEDGSDASQFASAYSGHPAMTYTGTVTPAAYEDWVASSPLPTVTSGYLRASVPPYTGPVPTEAGIGFFCKVPAAGVVATQRLISWTMGGSLSTWSLYVGTDGKLTLKVVDYDGTEKLNTGTFTESINGREKYILVLTSLSTPDTSYSVTVVDIADSLDTAVPDLNVTAETKSGTITGGVATVITQIRFGEDGAMNGTAIGHVSVGNSTEAYRATSATLVGWNAEEGSSRISRLGLEEGIQSYAVGPGDEQCGPQPAGTVLDIMHSAEDVDEGILSEMRTTLGLRYIPRASMYNQDPVLTLDYEGEDGLVAPLEPVEDDQSVTNDVTVQRTNGASARVTLDTGMLSTQPPPDGIGLYDSSYTLNLLDDTQPLHHAGWRLHIGTWDEIRYPVITVDLANAPESIDNAVLVDTGSKIRITNPPSWLPPGPIDVLVQGYTETMDQYTWTIAYNCTPAGPWDVAWLSPSANAYDKKQFIWADTEGSEVVSAMTSTDTTAHVYTSSGPVWTPNVKDTPFDWNVGGEVMTVVVPGTLSVDNPFFDENITGWTAQSSTISWSQDYVMPHPLAKGSLKIVGAGSSSAAAISSTTPIGSVNVGATYVASMWVYSPTGWTDVRPAIDWRDSSGTYLNTSAGSAETVSAGVWTYLEHTYTAIASSSCLNARARFGDTPTSSDVIYVWGMRVARKTSSSVYDDFNRTASSGWGTADSGQSWTATGGSASDYSVSGGSGNATLASVEVSRRTSITALSPDFDIYCDITTSANATGGSLYGAVTGRMLDSGNMYMARAEFTTSNTIIVVLNKLVSDAQTTLGTYTVPMTYSAGTYVRIRFKAEGSSLKVKAWPATGLEPVEWAIDETDSSITAANSIGTRSIRVTGNTNNSSVQIKYKNFEVVNPQSYTVVRSQNDITKAQSAGTDVRLAHPTYLAL